MVRPLVADQSFVRLSRPQSLRSFWPAAGIESSGSNHYERTKEITEFWLSGSLRICFYGACLKWLLPELSIPAAGQKDRRLWGRECRLKGSFTVRRMSLNQNTFVCFLPMLLLQKPHSDVVQYSQAIVSELHQVS